MKPSKKKEKKKISCGLKKNTANLVTIDKEAGS